MKKLLDYQKNAVKNILKGLEGKGVILFSGQQRIGKTLISLNIAKEFNKILFVTKKSAFKGIYEDLDSVKELIINQNIFVINYESIHKIKEEGFDFIIIDECHERISSFPKPSKTWKLLRKIFIRDKSKCLLMSGTAAIESRAQLYHEFAISGRGPWVKYYGFNYWWNPQGHYKRGNRLCGGYGVYGAKKSTGKVFSQDKKNFEQRETIDYAQVHEDRIEEDIKDYVIALTRDDAGHQVKKATLIPIYLENNNMCKLGRKLMKDRVIYVYDSEGNERCCVYEGIAQALQGFHMLAGGTLIDDNGEGFVLEDKYNPYLKAEWIKTGMIKGKSYVVMTAYIHERDFLKDYLGGLDSFEELKEKGEGVFVCSLISFSMGTNLSWLTGSQILYSLVRSGSKFSQVCDRQLGFNRKEKAKVAIPMIKGSIDDIVYSAVLNKENFNESFYKKMVT